MTLLLHLMQCFIAKKQKEKKIMLCALRVSIRARYLSPRARRATLIYYAPEGVCTQALRKKCRFLGMAAPRRVCITCDTWQLMRDEIFTTAPEPFMPNVTGVLCYECRMKFRLLEKCHAQKVCQRDLCSDKVSAHSLETSGMTAGG